jgi:hypothetical protein
MATQLAETFVLIRAALEAAAYALHIDRNPKLAEIWLRRHDDAQTKQAAKSEFTIARVRSTLCKADRGADDAFGGLYELSIDFGGHPNEKSVTVSTSYEKVEGGTAYKHFYVTDDEKRIDFVMRSVAQAGVCALVILQNVFSARFELLGIRHRILELRQGL